MSNTAPNISPLRSLAAQYPLKADIVVRILRQLLQQVETLHATGRVHGNICEENLALVDGRKLTLSPPTAELPKLGDRDAVEVWPPELQSQELPVVSSHLATARAALAKAGFDCDPRRIDLYQLGAMLCRAMTGKSVAEYLHSPRARGKIPPTFRAVVDGALGYAAENRFVECGQMLAALTEAAKTIQPAKIADTPGWGSRGFTDPSHTPASGMAKTSPPVQQAEGSVSSGGSPSGGAGKHGIGPKSSAPPLPVATNSIIVKSKSPSGEIERLGHYRIVARIGGGGMGDVYKAYEESLDRYVAIKVLPPDLARHDDFVRRFRAEATAVAKLVHPNVVQIHAIGEDAGRHYFAMHFVNGESLADLLHRRERLPIDETLKIIEQCLTGLGAAHRAGMIHRDIKPGNILLDHDTHRALLADFGLVKAMGSEGSLTATGMVMGTVDYIPPEQARGQAIDGRADLYSIGVLMYQMLSGRLPFTAESTTGVIFQHAYEQPPPLGQIAPDVPRRLAGIVTRLLAKNPEHRYQSAEEVLADIAAYRNGKPPASVKRTTSVHLPAADHFQPAVAPLAGDFAASLSDADITSLTEDEGWRTRILNIFRRHAPQLAEKLQNTERQVDGAIYEYERRRKEIAELLRDAEDLTSELAAQVGSHQEAAQEAGKKASAAKNDAAATAFRQELQKYEQTAADFAEQLADQKAINDELHSKLAAIDGTLKRLRSQRDLLLARLQSAQAVAEMEGGGPGRYGSGGGGGWGGFGSPRGRRWRFAGRHAAISMAAVGIFIAFLILLGVKSLMEPSGGAENASKIATPSIPAVTPPLIAAKPATAATGVTGRFYLACASSCQIYVNGKRVMDQSYLKTKKHTAKSEALTLAVGDLVTLRIHAGSSTRAMRLAFVSEDGRTAWSTGHRDFRRVSDKAPISTITSHDVSQSDEYASVMNIRFEKDWNEFKLPKFDGEWFWYGGYSKWYQLGGVVASDSFKPIDSLSASTDAAAAFPLKGKFYLTYKGEFEMYLNDELIASSPDGMRNVESKPVTLSASDVLRVQVKSRFVYRAIQLAFLSDDGRWMWAGRRDDFRVMAGDGSARTTAAKIAALTDIPDAARINSGLLETWKLMKLPNLEGDWIWPGGKNEWSGFAAVIQPSFFKSTANLPALSPEASLPVEPDEDTGNATEPPASSESTVLPTKGQFYVLCNGISETYLNGQQIQDHTKPVMLQENDILAVRLKGNGGINAYQIAFVSEDGRWVWPGRRQDFRVIDDLNPGEITVETIASTELMPRFGTSDPSLFKHWESFKLPNLKFDCMWIGDGGKQVKSQWQQMALVVKPSLFQPSDGIPLANKTVVQQPQSAAPALKTSDAASNGKKPVSSPKYFETPIIPLGDAGAKLEPGLVVTEFPRKPGSQDNDKQSYSISLEELAEPVGQPYLTKSLFEWKYDEQRNAVAMGYLKIEEEGTYYFKSSSFYDRNFLLVNNKLVCMFRDRQHGIRETKLPKGYVSIVSVGTVEAQGRVTVEWRRPFENEIVPIPENLLFHDPAALSTGN